MVLETLMLALPARLERAIFLGAEAHGSLGNGVTGWQPLKGKADAWERAGFSRVEVADGKWPVVLVLPGKSRDETLAWFAKARDLLEPGGTMVVAMPNTAGAGRFEKELFRATGRIESVQKHKCRAFSVTMDGGWDERNFDEWRKLGERRVIPGTEFAVEAGIFSADGIDPGSRLLVEHLPAGLRGKVADLGAGWGFLADAVLNRCPNVERVDLYEADARALDCARENVRGSANFHWHDVTTGLPDSYDAIVMNPPFHTGQATDVDLGRAFLKVAAASLKRGGKLFLVANRQLPYEAELALHGLAWRKMAEDNVYKVLFAERR